MKIFELGMVSHRESTQWVVPINWLFLQSSPF